MQTTGGMMMEAALVFGGLSPTGFSLSKELLGEGVRVISVSSAVTEEEKEREEENELFLGRNALFRNARNKDWSEEAHLILADTIRINSDKLKALQSKINVQLKNTHQSQKILFLSSLEVCGPLPIGTDEKRAAHPDSALGKAANEMELFFIQRLREMKKTAAVIFRTDLNLLSDRKGSEIIAALISGLIDMDHKGLDIVHFKKGLESNAPINDELRHLLPDKYKKFL
jgi:nucleoside-diphosphate-sugar epimerase